MRPLRTTNKRHKNRYWKALAEVNRRLGPLPSFRDAKAAGLDMKSYFAQRAARSTEAVKLCGAGPHHRRGGRFKEPPRKGWAKKAMRPPAICPRSDEP